MPRDDSRLAAHRHAYLTTAEAADYLRLRERKVYDLVRQGAIPCTKVTGKLLFPRQSLDLWLMSHLEGDRPGQRPVPRVLAGSQDPLLEWSVRESGSELALLCHGSGDGVRRLLEGDALLAGVHVIDDAGGYNLPESLGLGGMRDLVMIRWARRRQGLMLAPGNPREIHALASLAGRKGEGAPLVARRQPGAGADRLLRYLLARDGLVFEDLMLAPHPMLNEDDLALAVLKGQADAGLGVEAAARRHGLDFVPLHEERFDLAMRRRSYFEWPVQHLLAFAHETRFVERATLMQGYDLTGLGEVVYNA
ncbi:substrate-binding domain-containing protein [Onishia taeanensis]